MMQNWRIPAALAGLLLACVALAGQAQAQAQAQTQAQPQAQPQAEGSLWENPHHRYVRQYEGTRTCLQCHEAQARQVFSSVHYQWRAPAPDILNARDRQIGKINISNDFCTSPVVSWIGILQNTSGQVIGNGCSKCHAGLGLQPDEQLSQAQLENIDCLICHAPGYRREVIRREDNSFRWVPDARGNPELMLNVVQHVGRPTNEMCLRCHLGAGGGMNYKRGDLETALAHPTRDFDVHMGSGMQCIQCHQFRAHRVRGGGTQMSGPDLPDEQRLRCEGCHKGALHSQAVVNRHMSAVACTTCHIPLFARKDPTDMHRDWSQAMAVPGEDRYEPLIRFASRVQPVYAWWNGKGTIAMLDDPVRRTAEGKVSFYQPAGRRGDPAARIHAFKYHTARLPVDKATGLLIPVQVGPVFRSGDIAAGVKGGAAAYSGRDLDPARDVGWIESERFLGIFHGVQPKEAALGCGDCHAPGGRMDWQALGYGGDPRG